MDAALLPLVDFSLLEEEGTLASRVATARHLLPHAVKKAFFSRCLSLSEESEKVLRLRLNRYKGRSVLEQAKAQLNAASLRSRQRPWHVTFEGEAAEDAGGPFRSSLMFMCDDAKRLLMMPLGEPPISMWMPSIPTNRGDEEMLVFLGKLLGVGLRQGVTLPLDMPRCIWKRLAGLELDITDLSSICPQYSLLCALGPTLLTLVSSWCGSTRARAADFEEVAALSENCNDTVAQEELAMFADRLRASCFLDVERVVALLIRGLRAVVPREALHIFTWEELRAEVCGSGKMDVELLKRHTVFEFGDETFQSYFWDALRSFTNEQQGKFLRFVWARDRLPSSDFQGSRMRVCQMRCRGNVDGALPQASTCTFTLTLLDILPTRFCVIKF